MPWVCLWAYCCIYQYNTRLAECQCQPGEDRRESSGAECRVPRAELSKGLGPRDGSAKPWEHTLPCPAGPWSCLHEGLCNLEVAGAPTSYAISSCPCQEAKIFLSFKCTTMSPWSNLVATSARVCVALLDTNVDQPFLSTPSQNCHLPTAAIVQSNQRQTLPRCRHAEAGGASARG